jgi:hypothetical protein
MYGRSFGNALSWNERINDRARELSGSDRDVVAVPVVVQSDLLNRQLLEAFMERQCILPQTEILLPCVDKSGVSFNEVFFKLHERIGDPVL